MSVRLVGVCAFATGIRRRGFGLRVQFSCTNREDKEAWFLFKGCVLCAFQQTVFPCIPVTHAVSTMFRGQPRHLQHVYLDPLPMRSTPLDSLCSVHEHQLARSEV